MEKSVFKFQVINSKLKNDDKPLGALNLGLKTPYQNSLTITPSYTTSGLSGTT
jgi:hypothetical protein